MSLEIPPKTLQSTLLAGALLVGSVGCTLGPDPERPQTAADGVEAFVNAPSDSPAQSEPISEQHGIEPWWQAFGDSTTEELVSLALEHNTDLRLAAARVLEAQAQLRQSRGTRFPDISASTSANRSKSSFSLPQVGRVAVYSTTYSADLNVSYQLDLFGKLKRTRQAAWAETLAQEAARDTVFHTVVSEVVRGRARLSTLGQGVVLAKGVRDSWKDTLGTVERRYENGLVTALDLRLARENLASAEANLALIEQQMAQAHLALDVLVGRRPGTGEPLDTLLAPLPDLTPVPLGLPADLLDRRPDLRQAEMQLAAATSRVGAAMADLFPNLSLTGSTGTRSDSLSDLLSSEALVYNAIGNLLAPIFDGGRRRAEVQASKARVEQAAAAYGGAVLKALREVEDALVRDHAIRRRLTFLEQRLGEARAADRIARERYQRGVSTLLQVLDTERRLRAAEDALNATQGEMWTARIDLHLALGGDWALGAAALEADPTASTNAERHSEPAPRSESESTSDKTESTEQHLVPEAHR